MFVFALEKHGSSTKAGGGAGQRWKGAMTTCGAFHTLKIMVKVVVVVNNF